MVDKFWPPLREARVCCYNTLNNNKITSLPQGSRKRFSQKPPHSKRYCTHCKKHWQVLGNTFSNQGFIKYKRSKPFLQEKLCVLCLFRSARDCDNSFLCSRRFFFYFYSRSAILRWKWTPPLYYIISIVPHSHILALEQIYNFDNDGLW